jgi:hypothetical protein
MSHEPAKNGKVMPAAAGRARTPRAFGVGASLLCLTAAAAAAGEQPLWLAVGRPSLVGALRPLAEHRRKDGFHAVVSTRSIPQALAAAKRKPAFLLLVGDDEPGQESADWYLPAKRRAFYRWRSVQSRQFASDAAWGDLDGDLVPDVPVGRIPARTPAQVERVVRKILAFERRKPSLDDLRVLVWAGAPGYNPMVDRMVVMAGFATFRRSAPAWVEPWVILADPTHALCGWPPDQAGLFARELGRGGLAGVLLGHAGRGHFHSMFHAGRAVSFRAADAARALSAAQPGPPAFFVSCHCGDFTAPQSCLAESLLLLPGGPVAAVGATNESHPLPNYFTSVCLLEAIRGRHGRVGALWLAAQTRARKARNFLMERLLRDVEGKLEPSLNVGKLRRDQVLLYALLGDPATALRLPGPLEVRVERTDNRWRWQAVKPEGATVLHVGLSPAPRPFPRADKPPARADARRAFREANGRLAFRKVARLDGMQAWRGQVPRPGLLRLVAAGQVRLYAAAVKLEPPPKPKAARVPAAAEARRAGLAVNRTPAPASNE